MKKRLNMLVVMLSLVAVLFGMLPAVEAKAEDVTFKYYDYTLKETIEYTGVTPTYIINGRTISLSKVPAIINENGIALAACKTIFKKNSLSSYKYKSSNKSITVKSGDKTLVMYLGSKTAYLNGEEVTMNAAPVRVKYASSKKKVILVPTRFVAETLGYSYNWNSQSSVITIKSPLLLNYDGEDVEYQGTQGQVTYNGESIDLGNAPSIIISDNAMLRAKDVFKTGMGITYKYTARTGKIVIGVGSLKLEMELDSPYAYLNGKLIACPVSPKLIYNYKTKKEYVYVPGRFVAETLGYSYVWNASIGTSIITDTENVGIDMSDEELIFVTDPDDVPTTPTENVSVQEKSYFTWNTSASMQESVNAVLNAAVDNIVSDTDSYINVVNDVRYDYDLVYGTNSYSSQSDGSEVYYVDFAMPITNLQHYLYDDKLVFELKNCYASNINYGIYRKFIDNVETLYDSSTATTTITFRFSSEHLAYAIDVDYIGNTMKVSFFNNVLTQVQSGINSRGEEYITFTGTGAIKGVTSQLEGTNYYSITFSDLQNGVGANNYYTSSSDASLKNFALSDDAVSGTVTLLVEADGSKPYFTTDIGDNSYTIYFSNEQTATGGTVSAAERLSIVLPSGISDSLVTVSDLYYDSEILISLDGDYRNFYSSANIVNSCTGVLQIRVSYTPQNQTQVHICTDGIKGFKYDRSGDTLEFVIDRPGNIYSKIIILDAGHGGTDPGTIHGGYNEKDVNFSVIWDHCRPLFDASDIKVYYSRYDDTLISLYDRAALAEKVDADMFISVHHNSSSNTKAKGSSVYYSTINPIVSPSGLTSKTMANLFLSALTNSLGTENRGSIDKGFVVVRDNTVPSVLLEIGFMSNKSELALVVSDSFKQKVAETIFETVNRIFDSYPTGR